jgi:hypothetical protein
MPLKTTFAKTSIKTPMKASTLATLKRSSAVSTKTQTKTTSVKTPIKSASSKQTKIKDSTKEIRLAKAREDRNYAYDDWVPIQMGFADLLPNLQPNFSEVDKAVNYILDKNIPVRFFNVIYSKRTAVKDVEGIKKMYPKFKHMRFVPGVCGDDGKIVKRWKQLVNEAKIQNPRQCLQDLMASKKVSFA